MPSFRCADQGSTWCGPPLLMALMLTAAILSAAGCGPSRPDPLAVVKDGGDDDEQPPRRRVQAAPVNSDAKPAPAKAIADGDGHPEATAEAIPAMAPFDLSYLPADTELLIAARCGTIIRSSLVSTVISGRVTALDPLVSGFGVRFADIENLRIGIREIESLPIPTIEALTSGISGLSLMDLARHPEVSSTIVIQTRNRIDETPLRKRGDEVRVGDRRYFRLKSNTFDSVCACLSGFRTLVVSDEVTIQSLIDSPATPPRPTESFSFAREADVVVAVAPRLKERLADWWPTFRDWPLHRNGDGESPPAMARITDPPANSPAESDMQGEPVTISTAANGTDLAGTEVPSAASLRGAAFMLNLADGVAISIALQCEDTQSADRVEEQLSGWSEQLQKLAGTRDEMLSAGTHDLIDNFSTTRLRNVTALSTSVTAVQQADLLSLSALIAGQSTSNDSSTTSNVTTAEPPGAFAAQILLEGHPSLNNDLPGGMQLRGLARWQPAEDRKQPRQLEIGVVAFGGPAASAVATGHFQLDLAQINRLTPLKWLGTAHRNLTGDLIPIDQYVPIERDAESSIHPDNGVLAVFTVAPPVAPAMHLRRLRGHIAVRYDTVSQPIFLPKLRQVLTDGSLQTELSQAAIECDLRQLADVETLELFYPATMRMSDIQLTDANGTPLPDVHITRDRQQDQVLQTLSTGGRLPEDVGLCLTLCSEPAEMEIPFAFDNLPLPDLGTLSDRQRSLLVWSRAENESELPVGLLIEAQARWDRPVTTNQTDRRNTRPHPAHKVAGYRPSDDDNDKRDRKGVAAGTNSGSDQPLRLLVDLTGDLLDNADALGTAQVTSIQSDLQTELNFEGAYFGGRDATGEGIPIGQDSFPASENPPDGLRISFHFTPPLVPIQQLTRFNGSLRLRIGQQRTETVIANLAERTGGRISNRDLAALKVSLVASIADNQILVRTLDGNDEQLSQLIAVDRFGDPVPGVIAGRQYVTQGNARRRINTLSFPNGVPSGVGLRVTANTGVRIVEVPFRFTNLPVPPAPGLPGL